MATFTAGTSFTDGVTGDVTAAKLNALVANATPLSNFITDRTAETSIATDDLVLISDTSDSGALNKMTVANLMKAEITGTINSTAGTITTATIPTLTAGTTTGTASTFTSGTITTATIPTLTAGTTTGTAATFTSGTITTATIPTLTAGTTTGTAATFTSGTITTGVIPTLTSTTLITSGTGTAAAPAIVPTGDTNTGIFFPAADTIAFSEGGTESMRIDSNGRVGIGSTSPARQLTLDHASAPEIGLYTSGTERVKLSTGGTSASQFCVDTGGAERLRIGSDGQIGIGGANYGTSGQVLTSNGSGSAPSWQTNAPADGSITYAKLSTSATESSNVAKRTAKAWVNFNGSGTISIRSSFNVTSITDNGVGDYGVNFTSALDDANYSVSAIASKDAPASGSSSTISQNNARTSTSSQLCICSSASNNGAVATDPTTLTLSVFR